MTDVWIGLLLAAAAVLVMLIAAYNGLSHQRHEVRLAWGEMDAALKHRYDLLPEFLAAVKASPDVTGGAINDVMSAKNRAAVAFSPADLASAETDLTAAIGTISTVVKNDPGLRGDAKFELAVKQLQSGQSLIARRCAEYNQHVQSYNHSLESFPHVYAARLFGFQRHTMPASNCSPAAVTGRSRVITGVSKPNPRAVARGRVGRASPAAS